MWTKYNQFIARLKGKSDEQIQELIDSNFEIKDCRGVGSCFNAAVKIMFSTRTTTDNGKQALRTLYPYYQRLFPKLTTRRKYLSQVRQVIKATGNIELWELSKNDNTFNMNKVERSTVINSYKKQVIEKNKDKIQIDLKQIKAKIAELATSNKAYDKVILILLCIGSRPMGVLVKNTYKLVDGQVEVGNLSKKRDGAKVTTVLRPVLTITPNQLIQKWDEVRRHFKGKKMIHNGELAKDKQATLNQYVIKHFPWMKNFQQKSSMLRKIYADLSFTRWADKSKMNYNSWIQEKLGHEDLLTSFSYSYLNVADDSKLDDVDQINAKLNDLTIKYDMLLNRTEPPAAAAETDFESLYQLGNTTVRKLQKASGKSTKSVMLFLRERRKTE